MISCSLIMFASIVKIVWEKVRATFNYYLPGLVFAVSFMIIQLDKIITNFQGTNIFSWLISNIIVVVIFLIAVVNFMALVVTTLLCISKSLENNDNHCLVGATGEPGSGKTSSSIYFAVINAIRRWIALQWEYWVLRSTLQFNKHDTDFRKRYIEVATTYYFFRNNKNIFPMLYTNIPIRVFGLWTTVLTVAHAYQLERVASFCVIFFDEVGSQLSVDASKGSKGKGDDKGGRPLSVSDFARLCRHFGKFKIYFTEQCKENIYIDWRRSVSYHDWIIEQTWVFKPKLLLALYSVLSSIVYQNKKYLGYNEDIALFFYNLENYCRQIGFRKYKFVREGSTERSVGYIKNKAYSYDDKGKPIREKSHDMTHFYLPAQLNAKYNERLYKNLYEAPKELKQDFWNNDYIDENSEAAKYFTRNIKVDKKFNAYKKKKDKEANATKKVRQ